MEGEIIRQWKINIIRSVNQTNDTDTDTDTDTTLFVNMEPKVWQLQPYENTIGLCDCRSKGKYWRTQVPSPSHETFQRGNEVWRTRFGSNRQSFIPTCADRLARTPSRFSNMRTVRDCGSSIVNNRPGPAVSPVDPSSAPIRPGPAKQDIGIFPRRNLEAERRLTVVSIRPSFSRKMELQDPQVSKGSGVGTIIQ